ncbi:tetratricopeptide repeat protein [Micromonospora maritima]|uniref:tetratricopeptide repeat protein n=1 Tax=Micromonospora maritima TaxID=986711 RepID=UPI0037B8BC44
MVDEAVQLSRAGRFDDAVETGRRAVEMLYGVTARDRGAALPTLVLACTNLSYYLSDAGRLVEALVRAEEAVRLARELYTVDRRHEQQLVEALDALARRLMGCGRAPEALVAVREALALMDVCPDVLLSRLLEPYAMALAATGQHAEALQVSDRALQLLRGLAVDQPVGSPMHDALGRALSLHANRLFEAGRWEEAVDIGADTVTHFRESMTGGQPRRLVYLAIALKNQAVYLAGVRRSAEALAAAAEAVELSRELVAAQPEVYHPLLASCLDTYGGRLGEMERRAEAAAATGEAVKLYRALAVVDREAYLSRLAEAVGNLGAATEDRQASLALTAEAVQLRRELVADNRAGHLGNLALSLSNLANGLAKSGRLDEALAVGEETLELQREVAAANRPAIVSRHAEMLRRQAVWLDDAGRTVEALALGEEAIAVAREAVAGSRAANLKILSYSLEDQAARLERLSGRGSGQTRRPGDTPSFSKKKARRAQVMAREAQELWAEYQQGASASG